MQLLTASKLSTVAMLAMAAVLFHSPVSGVPMEKPAVEDVPPPKAPSLADYKSVAVGQPSPTALKRLEKIMTCAQSSQVDISCKEEDWDKDDLISRLPNELTAEIHNHLGPDDSLNLAKANKKNYAHQALAQSASSERLKNMNALLDTAWNGFMGKYPLRSEEEQVEKHKQTVHRWTTTRVWEQAIYSTFGENGIKDCPFELLRFGPNKKPAMSDASRLFGTYYASEHPDLDRHMTNNICRLVVNDAYLWLLRLMSLRDGYSSTRILSIMFQLKQFTDDETLKVKLEQMMPLFARASEHDSRYVETRNDELFVMAASVPLAIPVVYPNLQGITSTLMFLLAIDQHQKRSETQLAFAGQNLLGTVKPGALDELVSGVVPWLEKEFSSFGPKRQVNHVFQVDGYPTESYNTIVNKLLDNAVDYFVVNNGELSLKAADYASKPLINPLRVLARILDAERFKRLAVELFASKKIVDTIAAAGTDPNGGKLFEQVFQGILGDKGKPIVSAGRVRRSGLPVDALVDLASSCATICTPTNWQAFIDLFVDKINSTPQLPGSRGKDSLTKQLVELLVSGTNGNIDMYENSKARANTKIEKPVMKEVNGIVERMKMLIKTLDPTMEDDKISAVDMELPAPVVEAETDSAAQARQQAKEEHQQFLRTTFKEEGMSDEEIDRLLGPAASDPSKTKSAAVPLEEAKPVQSDRLNSSNQNIEGQKMSIPDHGEDSVARNASP